MNENGSAWVEQTAAFAGVLAAGVRQADQSTVVRSYDPGFPEAQVEKLVNDLVEAVRSLYNSRITAGRLRWTFEKARLLCSLRDDGALAVLIVSREIEASPEMDQLLAGF